MKLIPFKILTSIWNYATIRPCGLTDINGDGFINAADATGILQYAAYAGAGGTASLREFLAGQS